MKVITMDVHMKRTNALYTVANTMHPKKKGNAICDRILENLPSKPLTKLN